MKLRDVGGLIGPIRPALKPVDRLLASSHDVAGMRRAAKSVSPGPVFDYVDGGADDELAMRSNLDAFRRWRFVPDALVGVGTVDPATELFGRKVAFPLVLAPTGMTQLMHTAAEPAVAVAAMEHGLPYALSTLGTTSLGMLAAGPHGDLWFQLYVGRDRTSTDALVDAAAEHGYRALVVAVDTVVSGRRLRDLRNGLSLPPRLTLRNLASFGVKPRYSVRMLRSPAMSFPNLNGGDTTKGLGGAAGWFDPDITWADLARIRERWKGRLVIKGPIGPEDARRAVELGADGIHLSNHGGRQLDRTVAPIDLVPAVRAAVGEDVTVIVDSGVRSGADIAVAVALGADAAAVGRAYLYGLMVGGAPGVSRVLSILAGEFTRSMQLLGVRSVDALRADGRRLLVEQGRPVVR